MTCQTIMKLTKARTLNISHIYPVSYKHFKVNVIRILYHLLFFSNFSNLDLFRGYWFLIRTSAILTLYLSSFDFLFIFLLEKVLQWSKTVFFTHFTRPYTYSDTGFLFLPPHVQSHIYIALCTYINVCINRFMMV